MKSSVRFWLASLLVGASLLLAACGGGAAGGGGGGGGGTTGTTITIGSDGESLAYDKTTLTARAGEQITLKFKNNSVAQQHNWILIRGGEDVAKQIDEAGLKAGPDKGYIPDDKTNILAHTPLANPNSTVEVTFTAPPAGTYTYICTVPGHYLAGMKGTLTVN